MDKRIEVLHIGRFAIERYDSNPTHIQITVVWGPALGESGGFSTRQFEELVERFYEENF